MSGGDDCTIGMARLGSLSALTPLRCDVGVLSLAMDHSRVIAGCEDPRMRLWDYYDAEVRVKFDQDAWTTVASMAEERDSQRRQRQTMGAF